MGRIPYLPLGQGSVPTAEVLRESGLPAFDFPTNDLIKVPKDTGCPPGYHAVDVESITATDYRYCAPGSGPAYLPGEQLRGVLASGTGLAIVFGVVLLFVLAQRGVRASREAR